MKSICVVATVSSFIKSFMLKDLQSLSQHFAITIITSDDLDFQKEFNLKCISKKIHIPRKISFWLDIQALFYLLVYFRKNKFDIVLSVTPKAGLLAMMASFISRIKIRVHFFTGQVWANKTGFKRAFLKKIDWLVSFLTTNILVVGTGQKQFLIEQKVITEHKSQLMFHSLNISQFCKKQATRQSLLAKYHLNNNHIILMFLGRINKDKGILELIKIIPDLLKDNKKLIFFIVGEDEGDINNQLAEFKKIDRVFILGKTNEPEKILNLADVLILPSHREGCSFTPFEAAAMKIPAIVSDIYGMQDTVIDRQTGLKHKTGDIADIKEKYLTLINDQTLTKELGNNAYNRVKVVFNPKNTSALFVDYFLQLAKNSS